MRDIFNTAICAWDTTSMVPHSFSTSSQQTKKRRNDRIIVHRHHPKSHVRLRPHRKRSALQIMRGLQRIIQLAKMATVSLLRRVLEFPGHVYLWWSDKAGHEGPCSWHWAFRSQNIWHLIDICSLRSNVHHGESNPWHLRQPSRFYVEYIPQIQLWPCVGWITVNIQPDNVPEDGGTSSLIVTTAETGAELTLQEVVRLFIFDGHHRYGSFVYLPDDNRPMFEWYRKPLPLYLSLFWDGRSLSKHVLNEKQKVVEHCLFKSAPLYWIPVNPPLRCFVCNYIQ